LKETSVKKPVYCASIHRAVLAVFLLLSFTAVPGFAAARVPPEHVCDHVAQIASQKTGVPFSVLQAITRTETGRKKNGRFSPWPWTVNMEGKGVWFDTLDDARAYVFRNFKRGARSFDVGCFQINYKWHHKGFSSIDEMFEPEANAIYAAEFLKELYAEHGNWTDAAGAYHSRTPKHANRYKAIFARHRSKAPDAPVLAVAGFSAGNTPAKRLRVNNFPLLQPGISTAAGTRLGSLVPIGNRPVQDGFLDLRGPQPAAPAGG